MEIKARDGAIEECRRQIEQKLNWGDSDRWTNQDFENLSEKIQGATGVSLSITTLKRIWGKVRYESNPTLTTLNTLAKFLGFENWREFLQAQGPLNGNSKTLKLAQLNNHLSEATAAKTDKRSSAGKFVLPSVIGMMMIILITLFYLLSSWANAEKKVNPAQFTFSIKKAVTSGVPNSVVFNYDATAAMTKDSIQIQQSWDPQYTEAVSKGEHQHTSIYYYPGFFRAKLLVNHEVVKEHNLLIETKGWLSLAEQSPVPFYFKEGDAKRNGVLGLTADQLQANNIALQPAVPWIDYYNVRSFGDLTTDDFILETELRNDYRDGAAACQHTEIMVLTEGSAIVIPLSVKGCTSDLKLFFLDHNVDGKRNDLSLLGCDVSDWVKVRCDVKDQKGKIYINDRLGFETTFEYPASKITGIVFRFQGTGSVNSVKLMKSTNETVYEENF